MSRLELKRRLAWGCAALVFAVTSLSAFVRFARAGGGVPSSAIDVARGAHRICASTALLLAIILLVQCYTQAPPLRRAGRLAAGVVATGLALAVLGRFGADSLSPPVVLANLLGGFAMFTLACALAMSLRSVVGASRTRWRVALIAPMGVLVALQVVLGVNSWAADVPLAIAVALNMAAALSCAQVFSRSLAG